MRVRTETGGRFLDGMIRGLVGELEREVVDLIASPERLSARIRELISKATLEERRKSDADELSGSGEGERRRRTDEREPEQHEE